MPAAKTTALLAGGAGLAIAVAGFQTWVRCSGDGGVVELSGTGQFSSPYLLAASVVARWHGFPIAWVTLVLGVIIIAAAALQYIEVFDADSALKTLALPGFVGGAAAGVVLMDKSILFTGVPHGGLDGGALSAGPAAIFVLLASIATVVSGFALSVMERPRAVTRRPSSGAPARSVTAKAAKAKTAGTSPARPSTKKSTKKKTKSKSKKATRSATETGTESGHTSVADVDEATRAAEQHLLTQPRVEYTGGSHGQPPLWLTHWCAQLPVGLRSVLAVPGTPDGGPVLLLHPGGGVSEEDLLPSIVRAEKPQLLNDLQYMSWEAGLAPLFAEIGKRYAILELVRDDAWLATLMDAASITDRQTCMEPVAGEHGTYERQVTVIDLPVLIGAAVDQSGLVLRFAHRAGDCADRWEIGLSALRSGFSKAGMDSEHLQIVNGPEGSIELRFNDTQHGLHPVAAEYGEKKESR
ncbi:hypothetical protein [Mycobacteroides abscessus]|uniref:hypothetical protein n=1 Tax=Mycobacteroides abscessus TaxID=36809 RepID=UPI000928E3CF|nr:hypothetical protein [Mycobacteroides abscessus]SHP22509.1 Uncharacterised protein [Mycobacteroides abscessus subsp. abscessus]